MRWRILDSDQSRLNYLMREFQAPEIIARMIANRKIELLELSRSFFEPSVVDFHDPFLMKDMRKAVDRIAQNIRSGDSIFVFGDYDVDGTSSSLLYTGITALGGKVVTYIPNRDNEGYGLSELGIDTAKRKGSNLLITCDCGINAFDRINYAT